MYNTSHRPLTLEETPCPFDRPPSRSTARAAATRSFKHAQCAEARACRSAVGKPGEFFGQCNRRKPCNQLS